VRSTSAVYTDGEAWAAGPDKVYGALAVAAVALLPGPLTGRLALDVGAGTGAVSRALRQRGAWVIAVDRSESMLRAGRQLSGTGGTGQPVVADAGRLPFPAHVVDVMVAGFVLSQVPDPAAVLAELSRVTRIDGTVAATAFPAGAQHPVKAAVDAVLDAAGYRPPDWYAEMKGVGEARVGTDGALRELAAGAGLVDLVVDTVQVDISGLDVAAVVAWRLGMAHVAPYLSGLDEAHRRQMTSRAAEAVADAGLGVPIRMLVLRARTAD
jgi:SAM-dependent methyltransferase